MLLGSCVHCLGRTSDRVEDWVAASILKKEKKFERDLLVIKHA
jgi:hypothetical protein